MEYSNDDMTLIFLCGGVILFLIILGIAFYLKERFDDISYVKMELCRAYDEGEYRYWRHELILMYMCIIPGITPDRAEGIYRFFRRGKHHKKTKRHDGLIALLVPSVLGIVICAVCLAGGTFAWFTASQSTGTQQIQAAHYTVDIAVDKETFENGSELAEGNHTLSLTATGTASTGYCEIILGSETKTTVQFPKGAKVGEELTVTLVLHQAATLTVVPQWGTSTVEENLRLGNNATWSYGTKSDLVDEPAVGENNGQGTDETTTPETAEPDDAELTEYTVVSGDTLSKIANMFGVDEDTLAAYNKIADKNKISIGQVIQKPTADFEAPEETEPDETEPVVTTPPAETTEPEETEEPAETGDETESLGEAQETGNTEE